MSAARDVGEPIARGQRHQAAAERHALRDAIWFAILIGGVALVNAIVGLALIEVIGSIETQPAAGAADTAALSRRLSRSTALLG